LNFLLHSEDLSLSPSALFKAFSHEPYGALSHPYRNPLPEPRISLGAAANGDCELCKIGCFLSPLALDNWITQIEMPSSAGRFQTLRCE